MTIPTEIFITKIHADPLLEPLPIQPLQRIIRKTIKLNILDGNALQGDTGANCSATNLKDILWDYRTLTKPIPITTYNKEGTESYDTFQAVGTGIIKVIDNNQDVMHFLALHTPLSTGTIISPDRYTTDNQPRLKKWIQEGEPGTGKGLMTYIDNNDQPVSQVAMRRSRDGLWYVNNPILIPPIKDTTPNTRHVETSPIISQTTAPIMAEDASVCSTDVDDTSTHDSQMSDSIFLFPTTTPVTITSVNTTPTPPPILPTEPKPQEPKPTQPTDDDPSPTKYRTTTWTNTAPQAIRHLELWHQRMGHPSPRTLRNTTRVVDGLPHFPYFDSHFHCPFCDIAKMTKSSSNKQTTRDSFLPGTAFHMDIGFVRGPKNLTELLGDTYVTPQKTAQLSHDGYSAYLSIVDAASRYIFCFPLKSKSPPIDLIDKFLAKYGRAKSSTISTDPNGMLHKSNSFTQVCKKYGYTKTAHEYLDSPLDDLLTMGLEQPRYYVRTDNGNELAGSEAFRRVIDQHRYTLETTAPDSSGQNGIAERPHRTLKERIRCLLYTAGLGIEFWSDALLHAVWLYNRTYHQSIEMTPYQAWTGRIPCLDRLLTFGAKITARRAKTRTTATDPNSFQGIFLGYRSTMDILIYWDTKAQRRRAAKHHVADELQYGDPPQKRSPASKFLLEVMTGTPHHERRTDVLLEKIPEEMTPTPQDVPDLIARTLEDNPLPINAAAAKAKFDRPSTDELHRQLQSMDVTLNLFEPAVSEQLPLEGSHPTLGLITEQHPEYAETMVFTRCEPGTISHKRIRRWKSRLRGSIIRMIDDETIYTSEDIVRILSEKRNQRKTHVTIQFAQPLWSATSGEGIPTLHFDQMNVIAHHLHAITTGETLWNDPLTWPPISDESLALAIRKGIALPKLSRRRAQSLTEWPSFLKSEWSQLDKYEKQGMFGNPCPRPRHDLDCVVLPWVWTYLFKIDPVTLDSIEKSRGTCNGGTKHGKIVTLAETYAACVEQPIHRLAWAITAAINYISLGCDVSNAFAEAPPPGKPFYMYVDDQFREWWTQHLNRPPIPRGYVIPILRNLQGHPEAPRLWHKHINDILINKLGFDHTTHEPCLYFKHHPEYGLILILRQVDDFLISAKTLEIAEIIRQQIQSHMQNELNDLGVIKRFNGMDIQQTRHYIKLSCEKYIDKIIDHHDWQNEKYANKPIPMRNDSSYLATLELTEGPIDLKEQKALEHLMGFKYRQVIGEAIFAMTLCRIDIAPAIIKLSQYSTQPAKCHYQALKALMVYLHATRSDGLYYWRPTPNLNLPDVPLPTTVSSHDQLKEYQKFLAPTKLDGASDSTWATDRSHRRSTGGIVFFYAGGAVYYRSRIHPTVAQSSTEAELAFMTDAGKAALYLRSILEELKLEQLCPTDIKVDNRGARQLTNAQQPSRRTRHIDMRDFCILQWTEEELILFTDIPTAYNVSDSISKPTGRTKFYEHMDIMMGRRKPTYVQHDPNDPASLLHLHISSTCSSLKEIHLSDLLAYHDLDDIVSFDATSVGRYEG